MNSVIICGVNESESAKGAVRVARALSRELGLGVVFVRAVDRHPADALVDAAKEEQAKMIVVGSTGPRSSLLGSVSADVSRRAPCPVVVVPPGADATVDRAVDGVHAESTFAGGVARLGIGGRGAELAGGVARFGLGPRDRERRVTAESDRA